MDNPVFPQEMIDATIEDLVKHNHKLSYTAKELCGFLLFVHSTHASVRTVYRIMSKLKLKRYNNESQLPHILDKIVHLRDQGYSEVGITWNSHRIRNQRSIDLTGNYGIPDVMYHQPSICDATDWLYEILANIGVLDEISHRYTEPKLYRGCSQQFLNRIQFITGVPLEDFDIFQTPSEGRQLFQMLTSMF
ncbi:unnamed protein product [Mytilus coruscus]|uniref:Uncharacterized protein n=1 Tax=Mytilus coruscus TaxID=42192 RepID=A0A6J8CNX2_MYTCO|nr:unnamed protein product [Mytilus coruscus]